MSRCISECPDGQHFFAPNTDTNHDECVRCGDAKLAGMDGFNLFIVGRAGSGSFGTSITNEWWQRSRG